MLTPPLKLTACHLSTCHPVLVPSFHPEKKIPFFENYIPLYLMPLNTPSLTTVIGKLSVKATELSNRLA